MCGWAGCCFFFLRAIEPCYRYRPDGKQSAGFANLAFTPITARRVAKRRRRKTARIAVLFLRKAAFDRFQPLAHFLKEVLQLFQALRDCLLVGIPTFLLVTFFAAGRLTIFFFL